MLQTLSLTFDLHLRPNQIYDFRGAFIDMVASSEKINDNGISMLSNRTYQNGEWGNVIDQYPLIQYRVEDGKASICAFGEGIALIEKILHQRITDQFTIRNQRIPLHVISTHKQERFISENVDGETYMIFHYLPYDQYSDHDYHAAATMCDKIVVLQNTINHAISNTLNALGQKVLTPNVIILDIIHKDKASYKTRDHEDRPVKMELTSYFLKIRCNVTNLDQLSIGKHKSVGYGVIRKVI